MAFCLFFDKDSDNKGVVQEPTESNDVQFVPLSPRSAEQFELHSFQQPPHDFTHPTVPAQPQSAQATLTNSSSENHSVQFNVTTGILFNTGGNNSDPHDQMVPDKAPDQMNSNNSVASNASVSMSSSVLPVDVTGNGDGQGGSLLTGQLSSSTMLPQLLSATGNVLAGNMEISQGTGGTLSSNKSVNALEEEEPPRQVCPTCGRPF